MLPLEKRNIMKKYILLLAITAVYQYSFAQSGHQTQRGFVIHEHDFQQLSSSASVYDEGEIYIHLPETIIPGTTNWSVISGSEIVISSHFENQPGAEMIFGIESQLPLNSFLKNEDHSGTATGHLSDATSIALFPNPTRDYINVNARLPSFTSTPITIEILSTDGKTAWNDYAQLEDGILHKSIEVNTLPSGMYLLKITSEQGIFHKKFQILR